ncbi:hypothetical protein [Brevibacillus fortis]|uniref:hypothetical protein n=1 Tax=Brevibacillus fortis TaxID=2126352 RepID=UPI0038FC1DBC
MIRRLLTSFLLIIVLASVPISASSGAPTPAKLDPRKPDPVVLYQATTDGKIKRIETKMPLIHRANISPTGRFVYGERIGYAKADPTIPFLYDLQKHTLTQLSGFAKWSPKQDVLYIRENGGIAKLTLADGQKTVLVPPVSQYPVLDFSVSPDEQYMAYTRKDEKSSDTKGNAHLYLQHLPTLKMKMNDQYAWKQDEFEPEEKFYWMPNSQKLFYQTQTAYKELDVPTGLKYDHKMTQFPSYSNDMKYRYMRTDTEEYLLDLQKGKKVIMKTPVSYEDTLYKIFWSPAGHQIAAEAFFMGAASSRDSYMLIRSCKQVPKCTYPFGDPQDGKISPYLGGLDNYRIIGWAGDGKSYYLADLASTHYSVFASDKSDEYFRIYEQR